MFTQLCVGLSERPPSGLRLSPGSSKVCLRTYVRSRPESLIDD